MTITVYTNEDNPATLKIIIAFHLGKIKEDFEVKFCNPHGNVYMKIL